MAKPDPFFEFEAQFSKRWVDHSHVRIQNELLRGSLSEWIMEQKQAGELIEARWVTPSTKDGSEHNVYFLDRRSVDPLTEEPIHFRHVACGCIEQSYEEGDPELHTMFACETLLDGVLTRAEEVKNELSLADAWEQYVKIDDSLTDVSLNPITAAMLDLLVREKSRHDYWFANPIGGAHELAILSIILGRQPDELVQHAQDLSRDGLIEYDGDQTIKLAA